MHLLFLNILDLSHFLSEFTFYNWYYTMLKLKKMLLYASPRIEVVQSDLEGLLCSSGHKTLQVDEIHNINAYNTDNEQLYFEF